MVSCRNKRFVPATPARRQQQLQQQQKRQYHYRTRKSWRRIEADISWWLTLRPAGVSHPFVRFTPCTLPPPRRSSPKFVSAANNTENRRRNGVVRCRKVSTPPTGGGVRPLNLFDTLSLQPLGLRQAKYRRLYYYKHHPPLEVLRVLTRTLIGYMLFSAIGGYCSSRNYYSRMY